MLPHNLTGCVLIGQKGRIWLQEPTVHSAWPWTGWPRTNPLWGAERWDRSSESARLSFTLSHIQTFQLSKLSAVSVNVTQAPVFLTFLASKPGPVWRLTIQQNQQCVPPDQVGGDVENTMMGGSGEDVQWLEAENDEGILDETLEKPGEIKKTRTQKFITYFGPLTVDSSSLMG